jgi:hypothetical protein
MIKKKKSPVFSILFCCLLMVSFFLSGSASALDQTTVTITGTILLVTYDITVIGIDQTDATITWNTNGNADSTVEYGTTTSYGTISTVGGMIKDHTISLIGLSPGTVYHYQVISVDRNDNRATSTDLTFTTMGVPVTTVPTTAPTTVPTTANGGGSSGGRGGGSSATQPSDGSGGILSAIQPGNLPIIGPLLAPPETGSPGTRIAQGVQGSQNPPGVQGTGHSANYLGLYLLALALLAILCVIALRFGWIQSALNLLSSVFRTNPLKATADLTNPRDIVVKYEGGQGANRVSQFTITVTDSAGNSWTKTIGSPGQMIPLTIGSSVTVTGSFSGKTHIVGKAIFRDGSERLILDKYV